MTLYYSNHKLWMTIGIELIIVSFLFLFLWLFSYSRSGLSIVFMVLMLISAFGALFTMRISRRKYLSLYLESVHFYSMFFDTVQSIDTDRIARVTRQDHLIYFQLDDNSEKHINLNYLTQQDITKLLMYLRYTPVFKAKYI